MRTQEEIDDDNLYWGRPSGEIKSIFGIIPANEDMESSITVAKKAFPVSVVSSIDPKLSQRALELGVSVLLGPSKPETEEEMIRRIIYTYPAFKWFCFLGKTRSLIEIMEAMERAATLNLPTQAPHFYLGRVLSFASDWKR